jgi:hypothetical protein
LKALTVSEGPVDDQPGKSLAVDGPTLASPVLELVINAAVNAESQLDAIH